MHHSMCVGDVHSVYTCTNACAPRVCTLVLFIQPVAFLQSCPGFLVYRSFIARGRGENSDARVLTSAECIQMLEEKERKKRCDIERREKRKIERQQKRELAAGE